VFGNAGLDEIALDSHDTGMRAFLIEFHETGVAGDVANHDCGQATRRQRARRRLLAVLFIPVIAAGVNTANVVGHGFLVLNQPLFVGLKHNLVSENFERAGTQRLILVFMVPNRGR
jgi:hypothetical protein